MRARVAMVTGGAGAAVMEGETEGFSQPLECGLTSNMPDSQSLSLSIYHRLFSHGYADADDAAVLNVWCLLQKRCFILNAFVAASLQTLKVFTSSLVVHTRKLLKCVCVCV